MAKLMRMAGAFLLENHNQYFLLGNLKRPCDYSSYGFFSASRDTKAPQNPILVLERSQAKLKPDNDFIVELGNDSEELPGKITEFFMIERNGSMSERLWDLVCENSKKLDNGELDGLWLVTIPSEVWQCVRETVLQC